MFYSHRFGYTAIGLGSVSLLGDTSFVGGYSLLRASQLSNTLREQVFVFIN